MLLEKSKRFRYIPKDELISYLLEDSNKNENNSIY